MNGRALSPEQPWSVPVALADIPETGREFNLTADQPARAAIATTAGIMALPRLGASFEVTRHGGGLRVVGRVSATVTQNCVVTLEPLDSEIDEAVDLIFAAPAEAPAAAEAKASAVHDIDAGEPPETLREGAVDLGAIATEFLILGIDPYPRKPDAVFEAPSAGDPASHPFAGLAALKKGDRPKDR
jgi:uncharacterized metal-binding protein YceD (DUF177 family)